MRFLINIFSNEKEDCLERSLLSIRNQSFSDYQVLFIENGYGHHLQSVVDQLSGDNTGHFGKIMHNTSEILAAWSAYTDPAEKVYFLFLNSGDCLHRDTLKICSEYLEKYGPDILRIGARTVLQNDEENEIIPELIQYHAWTKQRFITDAYDMQSFVFASKLFRDLGTECPDLTCDERNCLLPVFALAAEKIGYISVPLYQICSRNTEGSDEAALPQIDGIRKNVEYVLSCYSRQDVLTAFHQELEYRFAVQNLFIYCRRLFVMGGDIDMARKAYQYMKQLFPMFTENQLLVKRIRRNHEEALILEGKLEQARDLYCSSPVQSAEAYAAKKEKRSIDPASELLLSVIIPVYNVEKYLNDCLQTVLASTRDIASEIILVNDGSTDRSAEICRIYQKHYERIQLIEQKNSGVSAARNRGVEAARGKYIAFVDSDDFVSDNIYSSMIQTAERSRNDVVLCQVMNCYDRHSEKWMMKNISRSIRNPLSGTLNMREMPLLVFSSYAWNKLIRRDFYNKRGFSFPEGMYYEDNPVILPMMYLAGNVSYAADAVYYYRTRRDQSGEDHSITQKPKDYIIPDFLQSMKMTLDHLRAAGAEQHIIDALSDKFLNHDISGLLNEGSINRMIHPEPVLEMIREMVQGHFTEDDISRQSMLTQKRIQALLEHDYEKLGRYNGLVSTYEKLPMHTDAGKVLRSLPHDLFENPEETVNTGKLSYPPTVKVYRTERQGETVICHGYLQYPRIPITEQDHPEYAVFLQDLDTLQETELPSGAEVRSGVMAKEEVSEYTGTVTACDYSGGGFMFTMNPEVFGRIEPGHRYALAVRYETPYYRGRTYVNLLSGQRNLFFETDGYVRFVNRPGKMICLERQELNPAEKVSVIVPVYDAAKYIRRFIRCVRKQDYVNLEILFMDDGSTDETAALCDRYASEDRRIKVFHLPHGGVARARNRGLEEYTGKYLMFADIDDLFAKNYVSRLYELITHSEEHVVTCIAHDTRKTDLQNYEYSGKKQKPKRQVWGKVNYKTGESHRIIWGAIYDRYAVEGICFDEQYVVSTDTLFFAEVLRHTGSHLHVNEELYCYILYGSSLSHRRPDRDKYDDIRVWKRIYEMLPETGTSHNSCQTLILEKMKRYLTNILKSEPVDMQLYRDICADIKQTDLGPLVMKNRKDRLRNRLFLMMPDLYMKLRRNG